MRLKVIGNEVIVAKVNRVIKSQFPSITPINCIYSHYTEAPQMVKTNASDCDAILLTGTSPYFAAKKFIDPDIISDYLPRSIHALLYACLIAEHSHCSITNISLDSYTEKDIYTVYDEIGIPCEQTNVFFVQRDVMGQEFERIVRQHEQYYLKQKVSCCLTALHSVWVELRKRNVPSVYIASTYEIIAETLHKLELNYIFKFTQRNNLVVLQIHVDEPKEYSVVRENEYKNIMEKAKTLTYIHEFAERINAAILETRDESYVLFVAEDVFSAKTNDLRNIDLMSNIRTHTLNTVSLGIGYGNTIRQAHTGARKALFQAIKSGGDRAFVANEDLFIYPVTYLGTQNKRVEAMESGVEDLAVKSGLSVNIIYQIVELIEEMGKTTFTAKELAALLGLSQRRTNRILERLDAGGFCRVIGSRMVGATGRPSRIIEFEKIDK